MNVSEKHKVFLWMLGKTGSMHSFHVFTQYGFETIRPDSPDKTFSHNHSTEMPENSENYKFICTAKNPFTRFLSLYKYNHKDSSIWSPNHFRSYFSKNFYENPDLFSSKFFWPFRDRTPDYFIRTEFLWHDYNKIPFIVNSKFNTSGALYDFCKLKINNTVPIKNPEEYYTQDMIDVFYEKGKKYFELLNYTYPF